MGRTALALIGLCAVMLHPNMVSGDDSLEQLHASIPEIPQGEAQPQRWSTADVRQHIDSLRQTTSAQAGAHEVIRILVAVMSQPDPVVRATLFHQLSRYVTPVQPVADDASDE